MAIIRRQHWAPVHLRRDRLDRALNDPGTSPEDLRKLARELINEIDGLWARYTFTFRAPRMRRPRFDVEVFMRCIKEDPFMTYEALGKAAGVSRQYIQQWLIRHKDIREYIASRREAATKLAVTLTKDIPAPDIPTPSTSTGRPADTKARARVKEYVLKNPRATFGEVAKALGHSVPMISRWLSEDLKFAEEIKAIRQDANKVEAE